MSIVRLPFPRALGLVVLSLVGALLSCHVAAPASLARESASLRTARALWSEQHIDSYQFSLRRLCECLPEWTRPVAIVVHEDAVVSLTDAETGAAISPDRAQYYFTIDGLFEVIADAIRREAAQVDIEYDDTLGFPRRVSIDYNAETADDEIFYVVSDFSRAP